MRRCLHSLWESGPPRPKHMIAGGWEVIVNKLLLHTLEAEAEQSTKCAKKDPQGGKTGRNGALSLCLSL